MEQESKGEQHPPPTSPPPFFCLPHFPPHLCRLHLEPVTVEAGAAEQLVHGAKDERVVDRHRQVDMAKMARAGRPAQAARPAPLPGGQRAHRRVIQAARDGVAQVVAGDGRGDALDGEAADLAGDREEREMACAGPATPGAARSQPAVNAGDGCRHARPKIRARPALSSHRERERPAAFCVSIGQSGVTAGGRRRRRAAVPKIRSPFLSLHSRSHLLLAIKAKGDRLDLGCRHLGLRGGGHSDVCFFLQGRGNERLAEWSG